MMDLFLEVAIHCREGRSRSATFVLAYLIRYCQEPLARALDEIKSVRYIERDRRIW